MAIVLSDTVQTFLRAEHFAVLCTLNRDGSPLLTTMWYVMEDDGTFVMNSQTRLQKVKNIQRDPRVAVCVYEGSRSASINGTVELTTDPAIVRADLERLLNRYIKDKATREHYRTTFFSQPRTALRLKGEKLTTFSLEEH